MPGKRVPDTASYVTPRQDYRVDVAAADSVGVEDPAIPVLDTVPSPNAHLGLGQSDSNLYGGWNAQLNLACIIEGFSSVTFDLWVLAENEAKQLQEGSSSSSSSAGPTLPSTGEWVLVESKVLTKSSLWIVKSAPPGKYKVRVAAVTGTGHIQIREQHAA